MGGRSSRGLQASAEADKGSAERRANAADFGSALRGVMREARGTKRTLSICRGERVLLPALPMHNVRGHVPVALDQVDTGTRSGLPLHCRAPV
jgi:hypothetical protein